MMMIVPLIISLLCIVFVFIGIYMEL